MIMWFSFLAQINRILQFLNSNCNIIKSFRCHKWAYTFDTASMRYRDLKIKSVVFTYYDLFTEGLIEEIGVLNLL